MQDRTGAGSLYIDGKKTWAIKHWLEQTGEDALQEVLVSLRDMAFQFGPWGESLSQYKFLFVGSTVALAAAPDSGCQPAYEEPTVSIDWTLKLSENAQANLFRRIRLHYEQVTAIVDEPKERRKYRQTEEDLLMLRNLLALWDQTRVFCQGRLEGFADLEKSIINTNHRDGDLREVFDQRPFQFAVSMLPTARAQALKEVQDQEKQATMEVEKQRLEVRQARWSYFKVGLAKDQATLQQMNAAPAKLQALQHRKVMQWKLQEAQKGEKVVQSYMSSFLCCDFVEKVEHAQQKVSEFRALVAAWFWFGSSGETWGWDPRMH